MRNQSKRVFLVNTKNIKTLERLNNIVSKLTPTFSPGIIPSPLVREDAVYMIDKETLNYKIVNIDEIDFDERPDELKYKS